MTFPTVIVTGDLNDITGVPCAGLLVTILLDKPDMWSGGNVVGSPIEVTADVNGVIAPHLFPNDPVNGLGKTGSVYTFFATLPTGQTWSAKAQVPNQNCNLQDIAYLGATTTPLALRADIPQQFTSPQLAQLRSNIGAAALVLATALTGFSPATATPVIATDTVLAAFGKLQGQSNTQTASIATNTASIGVLANEYSALTGTVAGQANLIAANTAAINANTQSITTANTNIAANTASITTANANIAANTTALGTANANIATNAAGLVTANANIATNAAGLVTANTNIAANTASIVTANTNIATNATAITAVSTNLAAATGSSLVGFKSASTGAVAMTVQAKLRDWASLTDFGAKGDNATINDVAVAAAAAAGGPIYVPPGTFLVSGAGFTMFANTRLYGAGMFLSKIKASSVLTNDFIRAGNRNNITLENLTIDLGDYVIGANYAAISWNNCTKSAIKSVYVKGFDRFGASINGGTNVDLLDSMFERTTAVNTQNQSIQIGQSAGPARFIRVSRCTLIRSALFMSAQQSEVTDNFIQDWMFGSGITVQQVATCFDNDILGNTVVGGTGIDVNNDACAGIENWGNYSRVNGNTSISNAGGGIDQGGQNTACNDNVCIDNGVIGGPGINSRYVNATYNSNGSSYDGNVCFNTNGAAGTQTYGLVLQDPQLSRIYIGSSNKLLGNKTAPTLVQGSYISEYRPQLWASSAYAPPALADGNGATAPAFACLGAAVGDFVDVSFSAPLQGVRLFGWVDSPGSITTRFENKSGGLVTLPAGTISANVGKNRNYADY